MKLVKVVAPRIIKMKVTNVAYVLILLFSINLILHYIHPNYLQMICDLPKWWSFLTYDGCKSHVNVTEGLRFFRGEG